MLIAIPSDTTDGLDATTSDHFGHCAAFTLVTITDGAIGEVSVLENTAHEHGGCMAPVTLLKERGVDVLLGGGMGARPLAGFQQVGIEVRSKENATGVREVVELYLQGGCPTFGESQTCGGGEGGCGHHHHDHEAPRVVAIEGKADIRDGRLVTLEYELRDHAGDLLDSSTQSGPMQFVFGSGQMLPPLEKAVAGLEPGAQIHTEIPAADAFGDRDETRILEAPRSQLPPDAQVGAVVTAQTDTGQQFPLVIVHLDDDIARLDGNHPLAGKDLVFDVTVKAVQGLEPAGH